MMCMHDYYIKNCLICYKGELHCDFGICRSKDVTSYIRLKNGEPVETRLMCKKHFELSKQLDGK
jgi:hypothetical protein